MVITLECQDFRDVQRLGTSHMGHMSMFVKLMVQGITLRQTQSIFPQKKYGYITFIRRQPVFFDISIIKHSPMETFNIFSSSSR